MGWMMEQAINAGISTAMYGAMGAMTYDPNTTDPLNQANKFGLGLGVDLVTDFAIMNVGAGISKLYRPLSNSFGGDKFFRSNPMMKSGLKTMKKGAMFGVGGLHGDKNKFGMLGSMISRTGRLLGGATMGAAGAAGVGAGIGGKILNKALRHAGGVGLALNMGLGFMGIDPATIAMSLYDSAEQKYRQNLRRSPMQMTQASSRYIQDQLQSMKGAGNEAEIMHN